MHLCKTYSVNVAVLSTDLVFLSSAYQHPEIVANIVRAHLPQQTLEFSHQDSSMLPGEQHTHVYQRSAKSGSGCCTKTHGLVIFVVE